MIRATRTVANARPLWEKVFGLVSPRALDAIKYSYGETLGRCVYVGCLAQGLENGALVFSPLTTYVQLLCWEPHTLPCSWGIDRVVEEWRSTLLDGPSLTVSAQVSTRLQPWKEPMHRRIRPISQRMDQETVERLCGPVDVEPFEGGYIEGDCVLRLADDRVQRTRQLLRDIQPRFQSPYVEPVDFAYAYMRYLETRPGVRKAHLFLFDHMRLAAHQVEDPEAYLSPEATLERVKQQTSVCWW